MRLEQIKILLDLAQTHSFNQTAERHYATQQSISYSVKQLEKELAVEIFQRSKSGVQFTPKGEHVLQFARQTMDAYQEMMTILHQNDEMSALEEAPLKGIRLNMASVIMSANMPDIIASFAKVCPDTGMVIKEVSHDTILSSLANGSCDMAVWCVNQGYLEKNIRYYRSDVMNYEVLMEEKAIAVISSKSELANKSVLSAADIANIPKNILGLLPFDYHNKDTTVYALYEDNNPAIHQQLILNDNALCFMSESMYQRFFQSNKFTSRHFSYQMLPIYHVLLRRTDAQHKCYDLLSELIKKSLLQ